MIYLNYGVFVLPYLLVAALLRSPGPGFRVEGLGFRLRVEG